MLTARWRLVNPKLQIAVMYTFVGWKVFEALVISVEVVHSRESVPSLLEGGTGLGSPWVPHCHRTLCGGSPFVVGTIVFLIPAA